MVDTILPLEDARAAFRRKAARDNLLGRRLLPFYNPYGVEEEEPLAPSTPSSILNNITSMKIRDRIKELRRVKASELAPNPRNWRQHPEKQRNILKGVLAEIGYADALLARELPDGRLQLVDGHLRAETTPDQEVPVLILDVTEKEADKLLVLLDPMVSFADTNQELLDELIAEVETTNDSIEKMLAELHSATDSLLDDGVPQGPEMEIPEMWQILITCNDETEQQTLYEEFSRRNLECKILNM